MDVKVAAAAAEARQLAQQAEHAVAADSAAGSVEEQREAEATAAA